MARIGRPAKLRDRYLGEVIELVVHRDPPLSLQAVSDHLLERDQVRIPKSTIARWLQEAKARPPVPARKAGPAEEAAGRLGEVATAVAVGPDARPFLDRLVISIDALLEQGKAEGEALSDRTDAIVSAGELSLAGLDMLATRYKGERIK